MRDAFDDGEFRPAEYRPDTELTLGPKLLLGLFFGLLLLCGLCFALGYSLGSRGAHDSLASVLKPGAQAAPAAGSAAKPSAGPQNIFRPQSGAETQPLPQSSAAGDNSAQPAVKPALPATPTSAQPASAFGTEPGGEWMVQIATVSNQEDADVLVGALRKRGYVVAVRRDPADNMFHVQVGPFSTPADANSTRQKLVNDGYNAVVQP
jgi:cell division septation protein DedD